MSVETSSVSGENPTVENEKTERKTENGPIAVQASTSGATVIAQAGGVEKAPGDVSASTIARMMGMATAAEFRVLEGKVDLLSTKINSITGKLERITAGISNVPSGSDLERIDVQISSMRTALNEAVVKMDQSLQGAIEKIEASMTTAQPTKDEAND